MKTLKKFFLNVLKLIGFIFTVGIILCLIWIFVFSDSFNEWCELRMCNVVEYYLDEYDGVSKSDMAEAFVIASERTVISRYNFKKKMTEDCFRHFTWNYVGAQKIGADKMQIIGDNHEYAFKITDEVLDFYYLRRDEYKNSESKKIRWRATYLALCDCKDYSISYRKEYVENIIKDKDSIGEFIDGYTAMDFINNYYGRNCAKSKLYKSAAEAFMECYRYDHLCLDRHVTIDENKFVADYLETTKFE